MKKRRRTRGKRRVRKSFRKKSINKKSRMMKHLRPDGYYTEKVLRTFEVVGVCEANTGVFR
jgi:hypothetical protein